VTEKKDSLQPELRVAIAAAQEKQAAAITLLDFQGSARLPTAFLALHGLQLAAGGGHLRRDRTATRADRHALEAP